MQRHRDAGGLDQVGDPLVVEHRRRLVLAVGVADRRGEDVDAGLLDEVDGDLQALQLGRLVGADVVLDALDALDLALDVRAVRARLGDDLDGLREVVGDVELVGVEQHGVPAGVEALGDHVAVRAVVEGCSCTWTTARTAT